MKKIKWIILTFMLLLISAVGLLVLTFQMPELGGVDEIKIEGMEGNHLSSTITAKIYNPNFYALGARKVDYILTYRDTVIGKGSLKDGFSLVSGDTTKLEMPLQMELNGIFAVHKSMLRKPKCQLDIHLEAEFTFLNYHQGLDLSTEIEPEGFIKEVLGNSLSGDDLKLQEMKWKSSNLSTSEFSFVTMIKNPLDIPLDLQQLDMQLYNEGDHESLVGEWKLEKPLPLKPNYSTRVPGAIQIGHLATGKGMVSTIFKGEFRLDAMGTMILQLANLPFEIPISGKVIIDPKTGSGRWESLANGQPTDAMQ